MEVSGSYFGRGQGEGAAALQPTLVRQRADVRVVLQRSERRLGAYLRGVAIRLRILCDVVDIRLLPLTSIFLHDFQRSCS